MNDSKPVDLSENNADSTPFSVLPLSEALLKNLASMDYHAMTPIQAQSLPLMLEGRDVIAKAKTGSGKTAAFGLSILHHLDVEQYAVQALVLCPTRELAEQVCQSIRQLARAMHNVKVLNLSGGIPMKPQLDSLRHGAHIIVGTPGRVQKHLDNQTLSLKRLRTLVLDEADRMLDMGFLDDVRNIMSFCPKPRQTLLFSATYPDEIEKLCREFMHQPAEVRVDTAHTAQNIVQHFYEVKHASEKLALLKDILWHHQPTSALVFCNTKLQTVEIAQQLKQAGFSALPLNGDMEQVERDQVMVRFTNNSSSILIATDVAARGLDIKELPLVINYELAFEDDVHVHRVGRTGRAGSSGLAVSLTMPHDAERLKTIESQSGQAINWQQASKLNTKNKSAHQPEMVTVSLGAGRKEKIRPGDILGALTKDAGLPGDAIGKIHIMDMNAYVAIRRDLVNKALAYLQTGKLKGRKMNPRKL